MQATTSRRRSTIPKALLATSLRSSAAGFGGWNGNSFGYGIQADAVYGGTVAGGTATDLQLTTAWGVDASYMHFWNKQWQSSIYGAYMGVSYNSTANTLACGALGAAGSPTCNNNFTYWDIGSETIFNLDSNTYVGLDLVYQNLNTASNGAVLTGGTTITDQHAFFGQFRVHRNFYP